MKVLKNITLSIFGIWALAMLCVYTITVPFYMDGWFLALIVPMFLALLSAVIVVTWMGMPSMIFAVIGGVLYVAIAFLEKDIQQINHGWLILLVTVAVMFVFLLLAVITKLVQVIRDDACEMKVVTSISLILLSLILLWMMFFAVYHRAWSVPWIENLFFWHYHTVKDLLFFLLLVSSSVLVAKWMGNPGGILIVIGTLLEGLLMYGGQIRSWLGIGWSNDLTLVLLCVTHGAFFLGVLLKWIQLIRDRE